MSTMNERIAEEIRVLLARRRLTASELARLTGMTQRAISRRLTGEKIIDVDDLDRISRALNVSVTDLLPREVRPNAGSVRVQVNPDLISVPASAERHTRCAPDVRSPSIGGIHRRPKARQSAAQPIAA